MNGPWNYALVCGWNDVVKANGLKDVDNISLWSFRCRGVLDEARRRDGGAAEKRHMRCGRGRDVTEADMPRHELCFLRYLRLRVFEIKRVFEIRGI
ncbi:hypothetical protein F2Q69_00032558 [Brassica cretica]|uniref:TF-B3 domain-containing protein n=1 Tax=Brassica cretica TaxID=69181 RepID=A0A8S9RTN3_BRACR|nr:hypothetical protein F2Q69_00032558 [Brassica cretica]